VECARRRVPHATKQHETEIRCYIRDPDGHLIEVGQTTLPGGWRQFLDP
jgi:catechol 2,3-dioxygenase-like lactoylglutathione lyase family enzyme